MHEAFDNALPLTGMGHFRMELQAVKMPFLIGYAGNRRAVGRGHQFETLGHLDDPVTVAHPDIQQTIAFRTGVVLNIAQQRGVATRPHLGIAILMMIGIFHLPSQLGRHGLHAVTDPQYRHAQLEHHWWGLWGFRGGDGFRATGKNNRLGGKRADFRLVQIPAVKLTIDPRFPHATGNQLGVLGTKIEDQDAICMDIRGHEVTL